jgi:ankyrin repeat protein
MTNDDFDLAAARQTVRNEQTAFDKLLLESAAEGRSRSVELLLDAGASIDGKDGDGCTPLHLAAYNGYVETARVLVTNGASIDIANRFGRTPLHYAVSEGRLALAQMLREPRKVRVVEKRTSALTGLWHG